MMTFLVIVVVAFIAWKGYFAVRRAVSSYQRDRQEHDSLREYLVANGATTFQSLWPFYRHALQRAFKIKMQFFQKNPLTLMTVADFFVILQPIKVLLTHKR